MAMIESSRDVLIQHADFERAQQFYENVLGLSVVSRRESMVGYETGSFRLYLERGPAYGPVFDFLVDDFAAAKARLLAAGCRVENEDPAVPRCYLRDPFGLVFNLAQR